MLLYYSVYKNKWELVMDSNIYYQFGDNPLYSEILTPPIIQGLETGKDLFFEKVKNLSNINGLKEKIEEKSRDFSLMDKNKISPENNPYMEKIENIIKDFLELKEKEIKTFDLTLRLTYLDMIYTPKSTLEISRKGCRSELKKESVVSYTSSELTKDIEFCKNIKQTIEISCIKEKLNEYWIAFQSLYKTPQIDCIDQQQVVFNKIKDIYTIILHQTHSIVKIQKIRSETIDLILTALSIKKIKFKEEILFIR